jgi:uncharacterized UBP type Zn finger protein
MAAQCTHLGTIKDGVKPRTEGCEECMKLGEKWLHLRMCLECGHVGCCDSSKGRHARAHFHETKHPLIQSAERGENWRWCYVDDMYLQPAVNSTSIFLVSATSLTILKLRS